MNVGENMKILMINSVCGTGSTGRICTDLYAELKKEGHQCKVAYGRNQAMHIDEADAIKIGTDFDTKCHGVISRITDKHGFYSKKATQAFITQIEEYDPDIIHLHNIHGYYMNVEVLFNYLKDSHKKVIWTLHDCWSFTGHGAYIQTAGEEVSEDYYYCGSKKKYPASYLMNNAKNNFARKKELFTSLDELDIITPSKWLADLVRQSYLKDYHIQVINNGIDSAKFNNEVTVTKAKYNFGDKKIVLGVAAVWETHKGIEDFLELAQLLPEDYQIVLVGKMGKQSLPTNITHISHTDSVEELAELYSLAEVFVNPTHLDNYPTVNLEALACGTPVLAYQTGGGSYESAYLDQSDGIVEGDVKEIYRRIQNQDYRNQLTNRYDISKERMIQEYLELYKSKL